MWRGMPTAASWSSGTTGRHRTRKSSTPGSSTLAAFPSGGEILIAGTDDPNDNASAPEVHSDPAGGFVVLWGGGSGYPPVKTGRRLDRDGSPLSSEFVLDEPAIPPAEPGAFGRNALKRTDAEEEALPSRAQFQVDRGDILTIETPGGGGYGSAGAR